jgi:hypothetical protein
MGIEVVIENLENGAKSLRTVVEPLADYDFKATNVTGEAFGHVEVAEWFGVATDHCDSEGRSLHDMGEGLADKLQAAATLYRTTDQELADRQLLELDWNVPQ